MGAFTPSNITAELYLGSQVLSCHTVNNCIHTLKSLKIHEADAKTASNILGIMISNTCSLEITDPDNTLNINNTSSVYAAGFGKGSKVVIKRGNSTLGTFYTDSWKNRVYNGSNICSIYCYDFLSYIGSQEMPELEQTSNITIKNLLISIFRALGLNENVDYVISSNLTNLTNIMTVTKAGKVRDTLNEIAQALIARITCDKYGKIIVKPAFEISETGQTLYLDKLSDSVSIQNNKDVLDYGRVKVSYVNLSTEDEPSILAMNTNFAFPSGNTEMKIEIPNNTQVVDCVSVEAESSNNNLLVLESMQYSRDSKGFTATIKNNSVNTLTGTVIVRGRCILRGNAYVYDSNAEQNSDKTLLTVENIYIQNSADAQTFANNIMSYISSMKKKCSISGYFDLDLRAGASITVVSSESGLAGTYYVCGVDYYLGEGYSMNIEAIKIS